MQGWDLCWRRPQDRAQFGLGPHVARAENGLDRQFSLALVFGPAFSLLLVVMKGGLGLAWSGLALPVPCYVSPRPVALSFATTTAARFSMCSFFRLTV